MGDATSISWWAVQIGPAGVLLFILWRVLLFIRPIVVDFIPYFKDLITGHVKLMGVMEDHLTAGSVTLKKVSETQDDHGSLLNKIHDRVTKE